ncbi:MAG: nucleotidyltransferase family protein [Blastocatellia bacterium]
MQLDLNDSVLLDGLLPAAACRERLARTLAEGGGRLDWEAILDRAELHLTAPLLRFNLAALEGLGRLPAASRQRLDESARVWAARHLASVSEARRLIGAMAAAGVASIPLKGAALMLGGYYPQPGLRGALDLDLLVDPAQLSAAEAVAEACGYVEIPGRGGARPRQRLENERNHSWPRRGAGGLLLELHHRAFHYARGERDLTFQEVRGRAAALDGVLLPSAADLALHLIHHTIVDLQSAHAILRTLADLHFLILRAPRVREPLRELARGFGFAGAVDLAAEALRALAESGSRESLRREIQASKGVALLLETALLPSSKEMDELAETARWFEYLDFHRHPLRKLGNLFSLLFTSRSHMRQLYGDDGSRAIYIYWNYLRRPFDLMRKLRPASLSLPNLRRVRALRRLASRQHK